MRTEDYDRLRQGMFLRRYAKELLELPAAERAARARDLWETWQPLVTIQELAEKRYTHGGRVHKRPPTPPEVPTDGA
jgi:hypothetical protein